LFVFGPCGVWATLLVMLMTGNMLLPRFLLLPKSGCVGRWEFALGITATGYDIIYSASVIYIGPILHLQLVSLPLRFLPNYHVVSTLY